ncbi:MAG: Jag N-terminal domain-containing protein, partial [Candidatus Dormibacteraeota bacterium]|nr:Jag N-terminal domain-containing protein [Candidatus Dormibacteraeota bacterium]
MSSSSDSVETTGTTVEEAVEKALEDLEEARENVEVTVLGESPQGARVRVTVRESYAVKARQVVAELLYKMGITAQVFIKKADDPVMIDVAGDNLGLLIGWRGET